MNKLLNKIERMTRNGLEVRFKSEHIPSHFQMLRIDVERRGKTTHWHQSHLIDIHELREPEEMVLLELERMRLGILEASIDD